MIELLAHIALAVGFFALGYVVRREQEPQKPPRVVIDKPQITLPDGMSVDELTQAIKVVGNHQRRTGRELPDVEVRALRPKL